MKFWITYAWKDNEDGDFSYLAQELGTFGVEAVFDKKALIPGQRLWSQISANILSKEISGWGYLLTKNSVTSQPCIEELSYALDRALNEKGANFPLIGLLHGISIQDVPQALRVRLCISMSDPNWKEAVKAGLEIRPPVTNEGKQSTLVTKLHNPYTGDQNLTAIEVRPRFSELMYWRFAVPTSAVIKRWGYGPSNGGSISQIKTMSTDGTIGDFYGAEVRIFGTGDKLSPSTSAYVVIEGALPKFLGFGVANEAFGMPTQLELIRIG